ncbi:MAG TPA: hypothetical protein VJQ82_04285 [Terriglobales bacterium]|nr:hypothetical protein [Terriglobales bacterium]
MYKLYAIADFVVRTADNCVIPKDEGNADYLAYLVWLGEGNTPLPADPIQVAVG